MNTVSTSLRVRVKAAEKKRLTDWISKHSELKIRRRKITESSLIRSLIRWFLKIDYPLEEQCVKEMRVISRNLSGMGGNLNQLAKAYNEGLITTPIDCAEFFKNIEKEIASLKRNQRAIVSMIESGLDKHLGDIFKDNEGE